MMRDHLLALVVALSVQSWRASAFVSSPRTAVLHYPCIEMVGKTRPWAPQNSKLNCSASLAPLSSSSKRLRFGECLGAYQKFPRGFFRRHMDPRKRVFSGDGALCLSSSADSDGDQGVASAETADANDAAKQTAAAVEPVKKDTAVKSRTLLERCDAWGLTLKPKVISARDKAVALKDSSRIKSILYNAKACALISLFIAYRAYRGFFVILPAVFREVYSKMTTAVENPFDADQLAKDEDANKDVNPKTGKVRARTTITVSILAGLVTLSYVISGAFKVLTRFVRTTISTSSVEQSFEAAADEVMVNEGKIMNMASRPDVNGERAGERGDADGAGGGSELRP